MYSRDYTGIVSPYSLVSASKMWLRRDRRVLDVGISCKSTTMTLGILKWQLDSIDLELRPRACVPES